MSHAGRFRTEILENKSDFVFGSPAKSKVKINLSDVMRGSPDLGGTKQKASVATGSVSCKRTSTYNSYSESDSSAKLHFGKI